MSQIQVNDDDQIFQSPNRFNKNIQNYYKIPINGKQHIDKKLGDISVISGTENHDRNHIVEYLMQELKIDHFYVSEKLIILVRVDEETYN